MAKTEILIVEDDAVVAKDIQNRLKNLGFAAPGMVPSGEEAIEKVKGHKPDLVLMDIKLKGEMNGTEAAEQIRSRFNVPVVYLTAYADEKVLERAKATEPFGYIMKPFEDRELNAAIEIALYRHKMEKKLKESQEWLSTTLKSIGDAVIATDKEGHVTLMNPVAESLTGWQQEEAKGKPLQDVFNIINQETRKEVENPVAKVLRDGMVVGLANHTLLISRDGTEIPIDDSGAPIRDEKGEITGVGLVFRDVRERREAEEEKKRLEAQLQQAQKMEAIGTLAGGVAHEFNNALMGIVGNIELLKMDLPEDEGRDKYFEAMKSSGHRMSRLTDQLLAYAEGGKYQPKDLKLDDFVIQTVPILQHDLNPTVRVETHFPKDVSHIKADHTQMQMVLSAIFANANEAIEDEGLIRITAGNEDVDEDFTKQHPGLKPGSYVCLTIEDDGKGMDEETRNRIFEPFFTTKFQGRGMGMAAVYGIVKNHDGYIYVGSELGKGTVVRIYIPAISAGSNEQRAKAGEQPEIELAIGEGTILVIEDEEVLVGLFRQILERLGYRVLEAKTGKEAVKLAKTFDGQIDLALLDIKLPDMDGGRVYPLIMEARPDLKVIVCSGYSIDGPAQAILDAGAEGFIQKPFSIVAFADKLREVLEGK